MTIDLANACVGWEMHIYTVALLICVYYIDRREEVQSCRVCKCTRSCAVVLHCFIGEDFQAAKKGF